MKKLLLFIFCSTGLVWAQSPTLVKDINPKGDSWGEFLDYELSNGNKLLIADDSVHGFELWTTDGTSDGTKLLKDINPNGDAFVGTDNVIFKNELYFFADDGIHGAELWKTNGTGSGTALVKDLKATGGQDNPDKTNFVVIGDKFYFVAEDDTHGNEVWESDGTATGTKMFMDLNPTGSINGNGVISLVNLKSSLVFMGVSGSIKGLWKVNQNGDTTLLKNFGYVESLSDAFTFNDRCYFRMYGTNGYVLYVTDGTSSGTYISKEVFYTNDYILHKGDLYFLGNNADQYNSVNLWKISAIDNKVALVKKLGSKFSTESWGIHVINDRMLFFAYNDTLGYSLYTSDGTATNTKVLYDFNPEGLDKEFNYVCSYIFNEELFISTYYKSTGLALYKTDANKVDFVFDYNSNPERGDVSSFGTIKNELYMIADGEDMGFELFKYGGATGVDDKLINEKAFWYPNPAHNQIHFSQEEVDAAKITELSGKIILERRDLNTSNAIDISALGKGIYILEIHSKNEGASVQRFIKD